MNPISFSGYARTTAAVWSFTCCAWAKATDPAAGPPKGCGSPGGGAAMLKTQARSTGAIAAM